MKRPLDGRRTLRGARLLGDNKTWRGVLVMWTGVFVAAMAFGASPLFRSRLPMDLQRAPSATFGVLLGMGVVLGELPNSFLKRRLGIVPGTQRRSLVGVVLSILDQGDFVLGAWVTLAPIWLMSVTEAATAFAAVTVVHLVVNVIGYGIGARTSLL